MWVGGWSTPRPSRLATGKETRHPLQRRLGGPQGRSERMRKISPTLGFDPLTAKPVLSRYTHYLSQSTAVFPNGKTQLARGAATEGLS
jgi:hypothetical protein